VKRIVDTMLLASNAFLREGVVSVLARTQYRVVSSGSDPAELRCPATNEHPAVLIVASDANPIEVAQVVGGLRSLHENVRIVVLARACDASACAQVLQAGAVAYLKMGISADALLKCLDLVLFGGVVLFPDATSNLTEAPKKPEPETAEIAAEGLPGPQLDKTAQHLSQREREILGCIAHGDSNKVIGRHLDIAEATVKVHVKAILRKINARNRTQAAIWAMTGTGPTTGPQPVAQEARPIDSSQARLRRWQPPEARPLGLVIDRKR